MFLLSPHLSITRFHAMLWANVESHWTKQRQTQHLQHLFTHFYCFDCIMVHWLMFADVAPLALPETSNWRYLPEYIFFVFFFFLLVSFCKCLYVHLYIQKTIWNRFKMWKIFSEIKMWCNPKRKKDLSVFYHNFFWILITRWDHRDLDGWHNILAEPSILCPSPHFHPHVFPSLSSLPSPAFISSDTTYPGLDFRLKTKHGLRGGQKKHPRTQREGGPQANWQLGVKVSLSPPCSYSFTLFLPCFCPFVFFSEHRLLRKSWTSVHTAVCWNEEKTNLRADWKLSKLTVPCKTAQHTHSKSEH